MKKLTVLTTIVLMACMKSFAGIVFDKTYYVPNDNCELGFCYNGPTVYGARYEIHEFGTYYNNPAGWYYRIGQYGKVKLTIESNDWGDGIAGKVHYQGTEGLNGDIEELYVVATGLPWGGNGSADNNYEFWGEYGWIECMRYLEIWSTICEVSFTDIGGWVNVQVHTY